MIFQTKRKLKSMINGTMLLALCLALFTGCAAKQEQKTMEEPVLPDIEGNYKIVSVVDGETIRILWGDEERNVKLIGVSVPDHMQKAATKFLEDALSTVDMVSLEFDKQDRDREHNLLAYVYVPDDVYNSLNLQLLTKGYAHMDDSPRNDRYYEEMRSAVNQAKTDNVGLWEDEIDGTWRRKK